MVYECEIFNWECSSHDKQEKRLFPVFFFFFFFFFFLSFFFFFFFFCIPPLLGLCLQNNYRLWYEDFFCMQKPWEKIQFQMSNTKFLGFFGILLEFRGWWMGWEGPTVDVSFLWFLLFLFLENMTALLLPL